METKREVFAMCKKLLLERKMSRKAFEYVDEAANLAAELALRERRGPGDYLNAMRRMARKVSVSYATLWNLRYRKPKSISVHDYVNILEAYADAQARKYEALREDFVAGSKMGETLLAIPDRIHRSANDPPAQEGEVVTWDGHGVWWCGTTRPLIASKDSSSTMVFALPR